MTKALLTKAEHVAGLDNQLVVFFHLVGGIDGNKYQMGAQPIQHAHMLKPKATEWLADVEC